MVELTIVAQVLIALTIYSVWLIRPNLETAYRAADAKNLREEFAVYQLPVWTLYLVGLIKLLLASALLAGIWISELVVPSACGMAGLMTVAVIMHLRVRNDSLLKAAPAATLLSLSVFVAL